MEIEQGTTRTLEQPWSRLAGIAAITAPTMMWTEFIAAGASRSGYNLLTRAASELAARGAPHAELFTIGFFYGAGVLTVLVGIGLLAVSNRWLWRLGAAMVITTGVLLFLSGVFPMDRASSESNYLHGLFSQTCFAIASLSPLVLLAGAPRRSLPIWLQRSWLASGVVGLAIELTALSLRHRVAVFPEGVFQRPFTLAVTAWFVATGIWLLRHRPQLHRRPA